MAIRDDLNLFSDLCNILIEEENNSPVAQPIPTNQLFNRLDLSLNSNGVVDAELKKYYHQL